MDNAPIVQPSASTRARDQLANERHLPCVAANRRSSNGAGLESGAFVPGTRGRIAVIASSVLTVSLTAALILVLVGRN